MKILDKIIDQICGLFLLLLMFMGAIIFFPFILMFLIFLGLLILIDYVIIFIDWIVEKIKVKNGHGI